MNAPPALIPAAASPQVPPSKSVENELPPIPGVASSAKAPAAPTGILNTSAALFRPRNAGDTTPTPYRAFSRTIPTPTSLIPPPPYSDIVLNRLLRLLHHQLLAHHIKIHLKKSLKFLMMKQKN